MQNHRFACALFLSLTSLLAGSAVAGTLGVTVVGSQTSIWSANYAHGNTHTASIGFLATSVEVYFRNSGSNALLKAAVYATSAGTPTALLSDTAAVLASTNGGTPCPSLPPWKFLPMSLTLFAWPVTKVTVAITSRRLLHAPIINPYPPSRFPLRFHRRITPNPRNQCI